MHCNLHLPIFKFDTQYKKGVKNCQANALSHLAKRAEENAPSAELDIPTIDLNQVNTLEFVQTKFD